MDLKTLWETPPWEWPEGTRDVLLGALRDAGTPEVDRLLAAELAGDFTVIDEALAAELLSLIKSSSASDELRGTAAIALGPALEEWDLQGPDEEELPVGDALLGEIQEAFRALHGDDGVPKEVRRRVLEASVRAPQPWHADAIRSAHRSKDEEWQLTALFCMRYVQGFDEEILGALKSRNEAIRGEAVGAAGTWELAAAWPSIAPLLTPKTPKPLLLAAIEAAALVCPEGAIELLLPLLRSRDAEVVEATREALTIAEGGEECEDDEEEHEGPWH